MKIDWSGNKLVTLVAAGLVLGSTAAAVAALTTGAAGSASIITPGSAYPVATESNSIAAPGSAPDDGAVDACGAEAEGRLGCLIDHAAALPQRFAEASDSMESVLNRIGTLPVMMPADGLLSSRYANLRLHPVHNRAMAHNGIDVAAPMGAPVVASGAGTVLRVTRSGGYGLLVELDHGDGLVTRYAHCSRVFVKVGDSVSRGSRIAAVGSSGLSTGPHLHYEVIFNGRPIDPLTFMN